MIKMAATLEEETYTFNRDIFREGDTTKSMYILIEGAIDIIKDISEKKYLIKQETMSLAKSTRKTFVVRLDERGREGVYEECFLGEVR